ncbi:MAG: hypothetical protein U0271_33530 [Polyangiaceae bacterium]
MSTTAKSASDVHGFEYDWLARDVRGHVALFTTAGGGYAPDGFLTDTEAHAHAIELLLELPVFTDARFFPAVPSKRVNTWKLVAERGLYAYDSDPNGGPYKMVAAPVQPITVAGLHATIVQAINRVRFSFEFGDTSIVTQEMFELTAPCSVSES